MITRKLTLLACAGLSALAWSTAALAAEADAATEASTEVGEVIVAGQRAAQGRATDQKHRANVVEEVLAADDVGKLPDQNVAEAVRRLPGVSVANDQGEGRYVIIRGADPNLALVTVNGQTAAAPEPEGRQVKLDDIPSSLIAGVKVIKSLTPDLDADSIAGQVNIDTLSAFDRPGRIASLHAALGYYMLNHENPYEIDGVLGGRFGDAEQFGGVLSANYSYRPIRSENVQGTTNWNAQGLPDGQGARFYNLIRERTGYVGNFDWRPNDATKLFLRAMYSEFSDNENRDRFDITNTGTISGTAGVGGTFSNVRGDRLVRRREENDNTLTVSGGGSFLVGPGKLVAEAVYSRAEKVDPLRSEFAFRSGNAGVSTTFDLAPFLYKVNAPTALFDPSRYNFRSVNYDTRQASEELNQFRVDYSLPINGVGDNGEIKVGLKYLDRKKTNNRDISNYNLASGQTFTLSNIETPIVGSIYEGRYPMGPRVVYDFAQAYVTAHPNVLVFVPSSSLSTSLLSDYNADEKVTAGYAMADFKFNKLTVVPGVRVEHTDGEYTSKSFIASTVTRGPDVTGTNEYTDVFPGVNARFDASDNLVFRGAVTTAIGRPGYTTNNGISGGVIPTVSVDTTGSIPLVTLGNADLKALRSVNYDAAVEYYLSNHGILSIAAFDKEIDDPIYSQVLNAQNGSFGGIPLTNATVTMPVNGRSAQIRGLEMNAQIQLDFFDGPLGGVGFSANVALIDAHADGVPTSAGGVRNGVPLINQSERVGTVAMFYEKYGVTGRLAYSFRSHYLDGVGTNSATDTYVADYGQLDARIAYAFNPNFETFLEASNLNNAPWRRWTGNDHQMIENEQYGASVRVGFTAHR